ELQRMQRALRAGFGFGCWCLLVGLRECELVTVALRNPTCECTVVEQQDSEREHDVVEEGIVPGEDYGDLPERDDREEHDAYDSSNGPLSREEEEKDDEELED